jgi:hypothetical protein
VDHLDPTVPAMDLIDPGTYTDMNTML